MAALAARLGAAEPLTALLVKMPCAAQIESAGATGFDLVIVDTEHGPAGAFELEHHLRAAKAAGLPALVRIPSAEPAAVLAALDAGATGIVVPHVLDAAGAEAVVAAAHYPPRGRRGFATSTRAGVYGSVPLAEHLRTSAAETVVLVQIEDAEAIERSAAILAVPGVSGVLIGAADLSLSLGRPGLPLHAEVESAIDVVLAATRTTGVPAAVVVDTPAAAAAWRARGAPVVAFVATNLIRDAFRAAAGGSAAASGTGGREPLVLLPGMLGDARLWDAVALGLVDRAVPRVARIDLDASVPELAESVLAVAPPRFALAGHSLGAIVALEIARRAPARVTRLALLNASALPASDGQLAAWGVLSERLAAGEFAAVARELATGNLPPARRTDDLVETGVAMAQAVGSAGLQRQLAAQRTRPDARGSLAAIAVPTVVLTGADDAVCPPERQEELVAGIPGARHVVVAGAGHLLPLERPEAVVAALAAWLEQ